MFARKKFQIKLIFFLNLDPLKDPYICGRPQCDTERGKFAHAPNIQYFYDYNTHVRTEFNGTGQSTSDIYITGTVMLTFPTKCEGVLKITDIELREKPLEDLQSEEYASTESSSQSDLHNRSLDFAYDIQKHDLR